MSAVATAARGYPPPRQARWAVGMLALVGFFLSTDVSLTTMLIEPLKRDLALSDMQIGLLQGTAFGLAFGFSSIPAGRLIDRNVRIRLLIGALIVWIMALSATALATGVAMLLAARIALGIVASVLVPASLSLIADLVPPERRAVATSMFVVGQAGGQAFGILAGGLLFDRLSRMAAVLVLPMAPWRLLYMAAGLGGLPLLLALGRLHEPVRQGLRQDHRDVRAALRSLVALRAFLLPLFGAMLLVQLAMQASAVWTPAILTRGFGQSPGTFAVWLSAVVFGGGISGAWSAGRLGDWCRRRGDGYVLLPAGVAALAIAPLSAYALSPGIPQFALMLVLETCAGAIVTTLGVVAIALIIPNDIRGLVLGANVLTSTLLGTAVAPLAVAALSRSFGGEARLGQALLAISAPAAIIAGLLLLAAARAAGAAGQGKA